ncbi:zinc finger protein 804A [Erpetoichthys calabaricus]|uniref:zinc finger protein 804A n=1 Tax=Erpetoichthys calabaricus TaxID=27687 RepID=UPI00223409E0|nr:zinc finger protein 804A [Erpetoichthys calabaricus]
MACYYIVISSTHLSNGHFRNIKGVFRGPIGKNGNKTLDYANKEKKIAKALEDLKANFYCELCDKQYHKHQEFDNHINSYDHAHKQRLKELKQREFARNVASKSRKDERKQEKALRRLHELAEQRKEVQCAPGCGPMFKSTTVAVETTFREIQSGCDPAITCSVPTFGDLGSIVYSSPDGSIEQPFGGKVKKHIYRQKVGFSFSFTKKASIKLESSAAVFSENAEEVSRELSFRKRKRIDFGDHSPQSVVPLERLFNPKEKMCCHNGHLASDATHQTSMQSCESNSASVKDCNPESTCSENELIHPSPISVVPTINVGDVREDKPDLLEGDVMDVRQNLQVEEDVTEEEGIHKGERFGEDDIDLVRPTEESSAPQHKEQSSENIGIREGECLDAGNSNMALLSEVSSTPPQKDPETEQNPRIFTKPSQPFVPVLGKDGSTVLQWPSEMLLFTKTEPSLSYSCNPLYFDFRLTRNKMDSPKKKCQICKAHVLQTSHEDRGTRQEENTTPEDRGRDTGIPTLDLTDPSDIRGHSILIPESDDNHLNEPQGSIKIKRHKRSKKCHEAGEDHHEELQKSGSGEKCECCSKRRRKRRKTVPTKDGEAGPDAAGGVTTLEGIHQLNETDLISEVMNTHEQVEPSKNEECVDDTHWNGHKQENVLVDAIDNQQGAALVLEKENADGEPVLECGRGDARTPSTMGTISEMPAACVIGESVERTHRRLVRTARLLNKRHASHNDHQGFFPKQRLYSRLTSLSKVSYRLVRARRQWQHQSTILSTGKPTKKRKRKRKVYLGGQGFLISWSVDHHGRNPLQGSLQPNLCMESTDSFSSNVKEGEGKPVSLEITKDLVPAGKLLSPCPPQNFLVATEGHPIVGILDWSRESETSLVAMKRGDVSGISAETVSSRETEQRDGWKFPDGNKTLSICQAPKMDPPKAKDIERTLFKAHCCRYEVKQPREMHRSGVAQSDLFRHGLKSPPHLPFQEAKLSRHDFKPGRFSAPFLAAPQTLLLSPDQPDAYKALQFLGHKNFLHQQRLSSRFKPVIAIPAHAVSSPTVHPIHVQPPLSSAAITIQHTILQNHNATVAATCSFLQPHPVLFPQVLPLSRAPHLPLSASMCPGSQSPFIPASQIPMVAPGALHQGPVTIHALPHSAIFPPLLPPHPPVIPLQPLF